MGETMDYPRLKFAEGYAEIADTGPVLVRRYVGTFCTPYLQSKADTGCWYVLGIQGTPRESVFGEGDTPALAIADAIERQRERVKAMEQAYRTLCDAAETGPLAPTP